MEISLFYFVRLQHSTVLSIFFQLFFLRVEGIFGLGRSLKREGLRSFQNQAFSSEHKKSSTSKAESLLLPCDRSKCKLNLRAFLYQIFDNLIIICYKNCKKKLHLIPTIAVFFEKKVLYFVNFIPETLQLCMNTEKSIW